VAQFLALQKYKNEKKIVGYVKKFTRLSGNQWLTPIILATWEAKIGRTMV
jgi:hypothetical protein